MIITNKISNGAADKFYHSCCIIPEAISSSIIPSSFSNSCAFLRSLMGLICSGGGCVDNSDGYSEARTASTLTYGMPPSSFTSKPELIKPWTSLYIWSRWSTSSYKFRTCCSSCCICTILLSASSFNRCSSRFCIWISTLLRLRLAEAFIRWELIPRSTTFEKVKN